MQSHHLHSPQKRAFISFILVSGVTILGTVGMHFTENMSYLDAFYFTSMIATAQGSAITPVTAAGKIFASILAFVSVGVVVAALGFLFGPLLGKLWHVGAIHMDAEIAAKSKKKQ